MVKKVAPLFFNISNIKNGNWGKILTWICSRSIRVAVKTKFVEHLGSFDIVHVKDATGHSFATRLNNIFIIGKGNKPQVSLPRGKGVRLTIAEERDRRIAEKQKQAGM